MRVCTKHVAAVTLLAAAISGLAGCYSVQRATPHPDLPTSSPPTDEVAADEGLVRFRYLADGTGGSHAGFVTLSNPAGGSQQAEVYLPMQAENGAGGISGKAAPGDYLYISVQNRDESGGVSCKIEVAGIVVNENTASGTGAIATCEWTVD